MLLSTYALHTTLGYVLRSFEVLARGLERALGAPSILNQVALHSECGILELVDPLLFKFISNLSHRHIPNIHLGEITHGRKVERLSAAILKHCRGRDCCVSGVDTYRIIDVGGYGCVSILLLALVRGLLLKGGWRVFVELYPTWHLGVELVVLLLRRVLHRLLSHLSVLLDLRLVALGHHVAHVHDGLLGLLFLREILSLCHEEAVLLVSTILMIIGEILGVSDGEHVLMQLVLVLYA